MPVSPVDRCTHVYPNGQCPEKAIANGKCAAHGGTAALNRKNKRMYTLARAEAQGLYGELADHEGLRTLRDEVAIARMAVQRWADSIKSDDDLQLKIPMLNTLLLTVKALVEACNKTEQNLGRLLDSAQVMWLAGEVIKICSEELDGVPDSSDRLERISERLLDSVKLAGKQKENEQ